jgi:hypothetical protein
LLSDPFYHDTKGTSCNTISSTSLLPVCSDRSRHAAADRWIWQSSRFELNGKIGSHRRQDNSASGMLPVAECRQSSMVANIDFRFAPRNSDFTAIVANIIS